MAAPASKPPFLITIDTEGDDLWSRPREATTRNADYLARFQRVCETHGLRPTWLVNREMALSPLFRSFAEDVLEREAGEVGMHLHAWDSPPLVPLTADDAAHQPYLIEYPTEVMRDKIRALTQLLEDTFGRKMLSHRAGRWGFDERYAELLAGEGYLVDCSVSPLHSWRASMGAPGGRGGPDYSRFPHEPYRLDLDDISRAGSSPLLEVPVTVLPGWPSWLMGLDERRAGVAGLAPRALGRVRARALWLRPTGRNRRDLLRIVRRIAAGERSYAELMIHSSELMPGGSPTFPTAESIEDLYADLDVVLAEVAGLFAGMTLADFHGAFAGVSAPA